MRRFASLTLAVLCALTNSATCLAQHYTNHLTTSQGLLNNQIRQLVELPNGQLFVSTEGAFSLFNGAYFEEQYCNLDSVQALPKFGGHSYMWEGDSILWLRDFYSLYKYDVRRKAFRYDYNTDEGSPQLKAFINEECDSVTHANVALLNPLRDRFAEILQSRGLPQEFLQTYVRDRQGGEWFGMTSGGILYVSPRQQVARVVTPVPDDIIRHIERISPSHLLLAGNKGIYVYNIKTESVEKTLAEGTLGCGNVVRDSQGRLWVSTLDGILCYKDGDVQHYRQQDTQGFLHNHMRFVLPLAENNLLVCNLMNNLGYFDAKQRKFTLLTERIPALADYRTMVDATRTNKADEVLVCTQNGVFLLDTKQNKLRYDESLEAYAQHSHKFNCVLRDSKGRIWLGTQNGLLVQDGQGTRRLTVADGLSNACIKSLVEDTRGRVWVGTACGVNVVNGMNVMRLGAADGIPMHEMEERGACLVSDSMMCFASMSNLIFISTHLHEEEEARYSQVAIVRCIQQNEHITLGFSNLNYMAPEHTRYRYRMLGAETQWQYADGGKGMAEVTYRALSAGRYTFEVQSSVDGCNWGETTSMDFVVEPPVWLSWWAKTLYAMLLAAVLFAGMHIYVRRRKQKLERENDERVNQLFELREEARHQFAQAVKVEPEKIGVNKGEEDLVGRMMRAIEANMDNVDYNIDLLARDVYMSRTDLYRKTQQMLGITPNNFLRSVRLKHAAMLLAESDVPVNQISLLVGFKNARYFSQCFQQLFGVTPSEYRTGSSKGQNSTETGA